MITFLTGNLLQSNAYALLNTVNTVGLMGNGIALQFKNEFPHNYAVYREACKNHELVVGQLLAMKDNSLLLGERLIINFPTKTHWRSPSEYTYIEHGLRALTKLITQHINLPILRTRAPVSHFLRCTAKQAARQSSLEKLPKTSINQPLQIVLQANLSQILFNGRIWF
ncbi:MAG: macro domain-containing protein [Bacteroidota bacterium]|nr:macro domain-containing protein [Bacteroidota bacterium]